MTSRRAALWALGVIFAANFLNYMDRQVVSALEKPLADALALNEMQFGLLWTLFTIGYMVCAVPIGLLADRYSRTRIFALCVVIWSLATVASGLAQSKEVLYAARVFIGVGEAGCLVIGPAIISDLFTLQSRGRALSIFYLGMPLGGTAAFILTGVLGGVGWEDLYEWIGVPDPMLDTYLDESWRNMFYLAGLPGFVVAALIFALRDPPRGAGEGAHHGMRGGSLREYLQLLRTPTLLLIILAQAFAVFFLIPLIHFGVRFFEESRGMRPEESRIALGLMALVAGGLGNSVSGLIGDRLARHFRGAYALLAGVGFLAGWPCLLVGFFVPDRAVFLTALTLGCFFYFICMPAVNTQIANVVSPAQRATAWALAVFVLHLLGDTVAPPLFGKVSSLIGRQQAFTYFSGAIGLAALCCLLAVFTAHRDTERVTQLVKAEEAKEETRV
jgi:predicted MFS family arabinose efflux permease